MKTLVHGKFYLFLIILVVFLVVWKRTEIVEALLLWKDLKWYYILIAVLLQFVNYAAASNVYHSLLKTQGNNFSLSHIFRAVTVMLFFNRTLPSLGIAGGAYMIKRMHQDGMSRGQALIIAILYYYNFYLAFFILLCLGFFVLFFNHDLGKAHILASTIAVGIVVCAFAFIIFIISSYHRLTIWSARIVQLLGKFNKKLKRTFSEKQSKIKIELDEIHKSWQHYWKDFRHMLIPLVSSLIQHLAEVLTLYIVFLALDFPVPIWILMVGYVSAGVLSFVTFVPNGIGVYEATMILLLNGLEVPLPIALSGVLASRALFYWLPIPVGFYFYRRFSNGYSLPRRDL